MPLYEVTLITKSLAKADLVNVLKRAATTILDRGCVIESMQSLGHRDLPYKRNARLTKEPVYSSNYFLLRAHMPVQEKKELVGALQNDKDLLHIYAVDETQLPAQPSECNLDALLKPPAYRKSVEELRTNQKLGHFPRMRLYKRVEREWRAIPKSYPIPPPRK